MRISPDLWHLQSQATEACQMLGLDPWANIEGHADLYGNEGTVPQWMEVAEQMRRHATFMLMRGPEAP